MGRRRSKPGYHPHVEMPIAWTHGGGGDLHLILNAALHFQHRKSTDSHGSYSDSAGSEADPDDNVHLRTELKKPGCVAKLGDMETEMAELLSDNDALRREPLCCTELQEWVFHD
ncbi:unnamed protein product [Symbiodinium sp. KB8]|nr:unnamed protein product [Symbiodinium sp. KB8]